MKKFFLVITFILSQFIFAQTAKEVIDQNIELSGGLTNWKLLNSVILQGRVTLGINDEYPIKIYQQRPNLTKTVITINKKETPIEGYDGKKGYAMNYATNKVQEYPNYIAESFDNDFIDWENKGVKQMVKRKTSTQLRTRSKVVFIESDFGFYYWISWAKVENTKPSCKCDSHLFYCAFLLMN